VTLPNRPLALAILVLGLSLLIGYPTLRSSSSTTVAPDGNNPCGPVLPGNCTVFILQGPWAITTNTADANGNLLAIAPKMDDDHSDLEVIDAGDGQLFAPGIYALNITGHKAADVSKPIPRRPARTA
jgi:hypothetical protein